MINSDNDIKKVCQQSTFSNDFSKEEFCIQKRYEQITSKMINPEPLTYFDLLILIERDEKLQKLLNPDVEHSNSYKQEASAQALSDNQEQPLTLECQPEPIQYYPQAQTVVENQSISQEVNSEVTLLLEALQPAINLLKLIKSDQDLASTWLRKTDTEGQSIIRLITMASQWDQLTDLWENLSKRVKKDQRAINQSEQEILESILIFYNLTLTSKQASLSYPDIEQKFDHQQHGRGTPQGERIIKIWLPGLKNAAGTLSKKPLVETE